ncbi:MAG: type II toxin-antitoxin system RelE/ParE family toxin, partial [Nitrospirales bacterium]
MARVLFCLYRSQIVALHAFIKKTDTTPDAALELARKRQKEIEHEKNKHLGSSLDDLLKEEGIFEETQAQAIK